MRSAHACAECGKAVAARSLCSLSACVARRCVCRCRSRCRRPSGPACRAREVVAACAPHVPQFRLPQRFRPRAWGRGRCPGSPSGASCAPPSLADLPGEVQRWSPECAPTGPEPRLLRLGGCRGSTSRRCLHRRRRVRVRAFSEPVGRMALLVCPVPVQVRSWRRRSRVCRLGAKLCWGHSLLGAMGVREWSWRRRDRPRGSGRRFCGRCTVVCQHGCLPGLAGGRSVPVVFPRASAMVARRTSSVLTTASSLCQSVERRRMRLFTSASSSPGSEKRAE